MLWRGLPVAGQFKVEQTAKLLARHHYLEWGAKRILDRMIPY